MKKQIITTVGILGIATLSGNASEKSVVTKEPPEVNKVKVDANALVKEPQCAGYNISGTRNLFKYLGPPQGGPAAPIKEPEL